MATEHEVISKVMQDLQTTRVQFENGEIYHNLPSRIGHIFDGVVHASAKTHIHLPMDDKTALARIQAISAMVKKAGEQVLLDSDIDYLLDHLASTNPQVRDKGIYFLFNDLLHADAFTTAQLHHIKDRLLSDNFLFFHILEPHNDGVFKRSFSVLILSAILFADRTSNRTFTEEDFVDIIDHLTTYIVLEQDGRGYVGKKGWAHAYTHIGNVFDEIMPTDLARAQKLFLLTVLLQGYRRMTDPLIFGEDHRLAMTFSYLTNRDEFFADFFLNLMKDWQAKVLMTRPEENEAFWNRWYNRSRLLQAMVIRNDFPDSIMDYLNEIVTVY